MKEHIIINKDRTVVVPDSVRKIGIQYDHKVNTLTFDCPRYADDNQSIDMSRMAIYINFSRNDKTKGSVAATNIFVDPDDPEIMHFDVIITRSVTLVNGPIICLVCAKSTDAEGVEVNHWNSELFNKLSVGEGLEAEELTEEEIDYITSLLQEINTTRAEVADMDTRVEDLEFNQEKQGVVSEVDLEAMTWTEGSYITGSGTIGSSSGYGISEPVTLPKMSTLILDATSYQSDVAMIAKNDHTSLVTSVDGKTHYEYYTDEEIQVYISCKTTVAKSAKIVRNVSETLSDLERENSELKSDLSKLSEDIADIKQNGTGTGNGATTAQANSLWVIIQKSAFAQQLTDAEINEFKTTWGITTENIPATGISIDKSTLSFTDSSSQTLIATVEPSNSTDSVTWETSDAGIATVSSGVVSPVSNGSCTITAKAGSYSASCEVTVNVSEEIVTLQSISVTYAGGEVTVGTALTDLTDITVTAHYSDGSTANVTDYTLSGEIAEGSNTITVSYGGKTTTFTVTGVLEESYVELSNSADLWEIGGVQPQGTAQTNTARLRTVATLPYEVKKISVDDGYSYILVVYSEAQTEFPTNTNTTLFEGKGYYNPNGIAGSYNNDGFLTNQGKYFGGEMIISEVHANINSIPSGSLRGTAHFRILLKNNDNATLTADDGLHIHLWG